MTNVIKRDGDKQKFNSSKIKEAILAAAKDAKVKSAKRNELIEEVAKPVIESAKKKRAIKAVDIRKAILGRLERRMKGVANAWKRFEKRKKAKCC